MGDSNQNHMNINKQMRLLRLWRKTFNTSDFDEWLKGMTSFIGRRTKENIIIADDSDNFLRGGHANDLLLAGNGKDIANGGKGNDVLVGDKLPSADDYNADGSTFYTPSKNHDQSDTLRGGLGNDLLINQFGSDYNFGGRGNDRLVSLSDSGIPTGNNIEILDNDSTENQISQLDFSVSNINPDGLASNDVLKGGRGADTFEFQLLINARKEIVEKHTDADTGEINWGMGGVAGENENFHDHWVDGIGNDTILDFNSRQGDLIKISGHTVQAILLENDTSNKEALIGVYSDQGADGKRTGGAHDLDVLGTVKVHYRGKFDFESDVVIEQKDYGAYGLNSNVAAEIGSNDELLNESSTFKLVGNSGDNVLIGDSGDNRIKGFAGDDKMIGNPGDDRLFGGAGIDHLVGDQESSKDDFDGQGYLIADQQASYNDRLSGGSEDDLLVDQYGSDRYFGGTGNDRIISLSDSSVPAENEE